MERVTVHELSRRDARRIAVRAQLLDRTRPADMYEVVRRLTALQNDPTWTQESVSARVGLMLDGRLLEVSVPISNAKGEALEHDLTRSFRVLNEAIKSLCSSVRHLRKNRAEPLQGVSGAQSTLLRCFEFVEQVLNRLGSNRHPIKCS